MQVISQKSIDAVKISSSIRIDGNLNDVSWENISASYDKNFNTFNVDMFYTWDFLYSSRLIIAWKNALGADVNIDDLNNKTYLNNLVSSFTSPHSNDMSMKIVYYLDYLTMRGRK